MYICTSEILKTLIENRFFGKQYPQVENTKWILCCRKMVLNIQYLRFLMYKYISNKYKSGKTFLTSL